MSLDVSLCVVRIESSADDGDLPVRRPVSRGRRETRGISIESLPISADDAMAEGGEPLKPVGEGGVEQLADDDVIRFVSGNPFVEKVSGIIHLFKEDELTSVERAAGRSQTVCVLAVPSTVTCTDLLSFLAPCRDQIRHVRIIKDGSPNQYMALITFRSASSVMDFYTSFNGIPFNSMEPDLCCHLVFVSKVETLSEDEGGSVAPANHIELPTCPVCLERMDESVDGILTIMCNHAFHTNCLAKWGDTSCPVCRYVQTPEPSEDSHCLECMAAESLWICLICGHVGCGRYVQGHAYQHYIDTHHCYSMQLGSNSVWDYVGDNFVHRILQNKADGKLVEGPNPEVKPANVEAKLEAVQLEYTYLLTSQLESQRTYYEEAIGQMEKHHLADYQSAKDQLDKSLAESAEQRRQLANLQKEKSSLEKKLAAITGKMNAMQKQLQEEKEMNASMRRNQELWTDKCKQLQRDLVATKAAKDEELRELRDQLRDVMFYLEAEKVVQNSPHKDEMQGGSIEVGVAPSSSKGKKGRRSQQKD
ncbi:unnamed protein product [Nesidiocoris tenuis]|uniref:Brca1-associated protein n=2 Tax=Nesidiocoris tenuis TaxID=355587 RepID=A0ABN7B1T6_9HEMI|nr:brca1-associated protein [Nesidiocoris tenuis]CAB0020622.1 unnamed protein product [Nesidiocoris tenuis]